MASYLKQGAVTAQLIGMFVRKASAVFVMTLLAGIPLKSFADHLPDHVDVRVGVLSPQAKKGQQIFNANCAQCHGENGAGGTRKGPPLIHDIYNPGHHGNQAFYAAVHNGARAHHWSFGDMPAQPQVGFSEMPALIRFVREVQEQNGIVRREHRM